MCQRDRQRTFYCWRLNNLAYRGRLRQHCSPQVSQNVSDRFCRQRSPHQPSTFPSHTRCTIRRLALMSPRCKCNLIPSDFQLPSLSSMGTWCTTDCQTTRIFLTSRGGTPRLMWPQMMPRACPCHRSSTLSYPPCPCTATHWLHISPSGPDEPRLHV